MEYFQDCQRKRMSCVVNKTIPVTEQAGSPPGESSSAPNAAARYALQVEPAPAPSTPFACFAVPDELPVVPSVSSVLWSSWERVTCPEF